jgi:hypothetical protein
VSRARFKVIGTLDGAGGHQAGTVEIDRETGDFSVRPHGKQKLYTMPLSVVATMVCRAIVLSEMRETLAAKRRK